MSKKEPLHIPLAMTEMTNRQIQNRFGRLILEQNSGFIVIETRAVSEPVLLMALDSPQRILLTPGLTSKELKKAKECCDKKCSKCDIPMRSSSTIGYFVASRIRKKLQKDKWAAKFFTTKTTSVLDKIGIQVYSAVVDVKQKSKQTVS